MKPTLFILTFAACALPLVAAQVQQPKVPAALLDAAELPPAYAVHVRGWLGERFDANLTNRMENIETEPLLAGFRKKPGSHPWIGEHVGKWMHAATLAWAASDDKILREKLDAVAADLIATQEPDGYLGTYVPGKRFGLFEGSDWDVWSHKYNLIGLLTYYEYTGNEAALNCCQKVGDLLIKTFGPDKKSILSAGTHVGMAATSVLEPMVILYRFTGDKRYLEFCQYIVKSWGEEGGPRIIQTLLNEKQVNKTANGKAYEMLSNLVGLCELARATGDRQLLTPVMNAWQDVVSKRLYITGSASQAEHFRDDHYLPNGTDARVGETCVTATWIQFNLQLLRLTGDARFGNELEKTIYNHLAAAQHPAGSDWCYFTALEGRKKYDKGITCCHSSGPRGISLAGQQAYLFSSKAGKECIFVNTFETSHAVLAVGGKSIDVRQQSQFPNAGESRLTLSAQDGPVESAVAIRVPTWSPELQLELNGKAIESQKQNGWITIARRSWSKGDVLTVRYTLKPEIVQGEHTNAKLAALRYGPFVMAYDAKQNPGMPLPALVGFEKESGAAKAEKGLRMRWPVRSARLKESKEAVFVPFADAGADGGTYRVWLHAPGTSLENATSLLAGGDESRSRSGNMEGSIIDGDASSLVVTFDNKKSLEDWFAVTLEEPVRVGRVVFTHGNTFHDGGWFDASAGKPRVQVKASRDGAWKDAGTLSDYPATTQTDNGNLKPGQSKFSCKLNAPADVYGVRVIGAPAGGDNPAQAFSSCGELEAFAE